ncbi:hypothetical protein EGR_03948 [Echinococcus granulosus]|uniref:Uncharacterized protein n=1 Tax=Echinococcus granulosus TaxID=6210 RepID=W6UJQ2_ECHGR|nr:hypothetical protein EGR_03948 [Echinococcus granulosus]EUB61273.1 hypothetical protein EGR_03948 [Echinococcus granulosus]
MPEQWDITYKKMTLLRIIIVTSANTTLWCLSAPSFCVSSENQLSLALKKIFARTRIKWQNYTNQSVIDVIVVVVVVNFVLFLLQNNL